MTTTSEWKGGSGAFDNARKWSPVGVPDMDDNADFAKGGKIYSNAGGVSEVAQLSIEASVTFAGVNGSDVPDVDATNGLSVYGGDLTLDAGAILGTGLTGVVEGQPPASAYVDNGGKVDVAGGRFDVGAGGLVVGGNGAGTLLVNKSGIVNVATSSPNYGALTLGNEAGSSGSMTVTSKASLTISEGGINFGYSGAAKVVVSDGGTITTDQTGDSDAAVGLGATSTGSGNLTIEGAGSTVTVGGGSVNDGFSGKGTITVKSGGTLAVQFAEVGINLAGAAGGNGTLTVEDATLTDVGELFVGDLGTGKYLQKEGARATIGTGVDQNTAPSVDLGVEAGSSGTAEISGSGTRLTVAGQINIGDFGKGSFTVQDGATVGSGDTSGKTYAGLALGLESGGNGSMKVTGAGSSLTNTGQFVIASYGKAAVTLEDGGKVSTSISASLGVDGADIGAGAKSSGSLVVDTGSSFTDMSDLEVGVSGTGKVTASGDAAVIADGAMVLGESSGGKGSGVFTGGAELSVGGDLTVGGAAKSTGTLSFAGTGSFPAELVYGGILAVGFEGTGTLTIGAGVLAEQKSGSGGTINLGTGSTSKGSIIVDGTLDGGALTMGRHSGSSVIKAALTIDGGTVNLTGAATVNGVATISLENGVLNTSGLDFLGGSLTGYGTVNAAVSAAALTATGGTLQVTGALTGRGLATIASGSTLILGGGVAAQTDINFASASGVLQLSDPGAMLGKLQGFAAGTTIDLLGAAYKSFTYNTKNDKLTITPDSGAKIVLDFAGSYTKTSFELTNTSGGIVITHS